MKKLNNIKQIMKKVIIDTYLNSKDNYEKLVNYFLEEDN